MPTLSLATQEILKTVVVVFLAASLSGVLPTAFGISRLDVHPVAPAQLVMT